jgi:hypothetical protein
MTNSKFEVQQFEGDETVYCRETKCSQGHC